MVGHAEDNFLDIPVQRGMRVRGTKEAMVHRHSETHLGKYLKFLD